MTTWQKRLPALIALLVLALFPFILALLTGEPIDAGRPKFWQGLLIQVFIFAVYAMSYDILLGYTGLISFGHAMFFGTGAYASGIMFKHFGWSLPATVGMVLVVIFIQSLVIGLLSLRVKGVYFAMVTLAFAQMFFILAEATDFRDYTGAEDGLQAIPVPGFISPTDERLRFYYLALIFMVVMYLVARRIINSPTGRVMIAIRENETRAAALGFNPFHFKLIAVMVAGIMAGLAGMLNAMWNLNASPSTLGVDRTIDALLMTIIGGVGTLIGPMIGAGVLELLGHWLNNTFGPRWPLIFGILFVVIILFIPQGLVGAWQQRALSRREGWQRLLKPLKVSTVSGKQ